MRQGTFGTLICMAVLLFSAHAFGSTMNADRLAGVSVSVTNHWLELYVYEADVTNITGAGCLSDDKYVIRLGDGQPNYKEILSVALMAFASKQPVFLAFDKNSCALEELGLRPQS